FLEKQAGVIQLFGVVHLTDLSEPHLEGGIIPTNVFSHVAMTYNAATGVQAIYVNGIQVQSLTNNPLGLCTSEKNVLIGGEDSFLPRRFPGLIDEVQIFDRALSAAEIQTIVNGCNLACVTPVARWPGEGNGAEIQGNNNATLNNITFVP